MISIFQSCFSFFFALSFFQCVVTSSQSVQDTKVCACACVSLTLEGHEHLLGLHIPCTPPVAILLFKFKGGNMCKLDDNLHVFFLLPIKVQLAKLLTNDLFFENTFAKDWQTKTGLLCRETNSLKWRNMIYYRMKNEGASLKCRRKCSFLCN